MLHEKLSTQKSLFCGAVQHLDGWSTKLDLLLLFTDLTQQKLI